MQNYRNGKLVPTLGTVTDKAHHAVLRKPVTNAFAMSTIIRSEPFVDDTIRHMIKRLDEEFTGPGCTPKQKCDIDNWLKYCESAEAADPRKYRVTEGD